MRILRLLPAVVVGLGLTACEPVAEPIPDELQPMFMMDAPFMTSVSGSAGYTRDWPDGSTTWATFTFNARKDAAGQVVGRFQTNNHGRSWMKGIIKCFRTNYEEAWLGVNVESASSESLLGIRGFYVVDMGEGAGAAPDIISALVNLQNPRGLWWYESPEEFCNDPEPPGPLSSGVEIEAGNIWVKYGPPRSVYKQ